MFLESRPSAAEYGNKFMGNFVSDQTLINEIMLFNPERESLTKGKILDPYLRELFV